jgi:glucan biosynthesis protein
VAGSAARCGAGRAGGRWVTETVAAAAAAAAARGLLVDYAGGGLAPQQRTEAPFVVAGANRVVVGEVVDRESPVSGGMRQSCNAGNGRGDKFLEWNEIVGGLRGKGKKEGKATSLVEKC